jgi:spore germination protein (amino acid permease)
MKKYAHNDLTLFQFILLIHGTQVGIGVLSIPRELAEVAGTDGWISIVIGWGMAVLASLLIISVMKRYPRQTLIDLLPHLLGKWLGNACIVLVILYCLFASVTILGSTVGILNVWILSQTPGYMIAILFSIPTYMILRSGVNIIGRYAELIFYLTLWMPLVMLTTLKDTNWLNLLPVFKDGWAPILAGTKLTVYSFLGFELAFFLYPFLQKKKYAALGIVAANTLSLLVFMQVTLLCFTYFSPDEITHYTWPTLNLWKMIEFRFLERIDILFLAFYLLILSTSVFPYIYFSVFSSSQLFGLSDHKKHLKVLLVLIIVAFWLYTPTFIDLKKWNQLWSQSGLIFGYILPVLLAVPILLFHKSRRGREG